MIWAYLIFAGTCVYALIESENLLSLPGFWLSVLWIAAHRFNRWLKRKPEDSPATVEVDYSDPHILQLGLGGVSSSAPAEELDMFAGLRNWKTGDTSEEVAIASCALSGRSEAYLRALLASATLRNDEPGRIVAAASRRLLQGEKSSTEA